MRAEDVVIPEDALSESFLAATGPGGQNVNKVATAVQLRLDVFKLGLSPDVYERLKRIAGSKMTQAGELLVTARRFRTQDANRQDARARLAQMIADAHIVQAKRRRTRPSKAAKARRVEQEGAARRGQARARESGFRLMYDFKIEAADKATMYRDLASALEGLVAGEPDADRQHGQCRGADLGNLARPQLGRLLPQCRRRAGARPVPGPPGVHPHPVRQGVCGAAAASRQVQRVDDVHAFPGHIACDAASVSELVVPIVRDGELLARARPRQPDSGAVRCGG